jgi:hypothetical protein
MLVISLIISKHNLRTLYITCTLYHSGAQLHFLYNNYVQRQQLQSTRETRVHTYRFPDFVLIISAFYFTP